MLENYLIWQALEFMKREILRLELTEKGKKGLYKMDILVTNFWNRLEKDVLESKNISYIPDFLETFGKEAILSTIRILKDKLDISTIAQEIFDSIKNDIKI